MVQPHQDLQVSHSSTLRQTHSKVRRFVLILSYKIPLFSPSFQRKFCIREDACLIVKPLIPHTHSCVWGINHIGDLLGFGLWHRCDYWLNVEQKNHGERTDDIRVDEKSL